MQAGYGMQQARLREELKQALIPPSNNPFGSRGFKINI